MKYLAEKRAPRIDQTQAMAAGASFDAAVKAKLHKDLIDDGDPVYSFEALFESQVEPQNRDWGRPVAAHLLSCYEKTGAYEEIRRLLSVGVEAPVFESTVTRTIEGVPLLGKPDLRTKLQKPGGYSWQTFTIIGDWKVKGYCSKSNTSPTKNYRMVRDAFDAVKQNKTNGQAHAGYKPMDHFGLDINSQCLSYASTTYGDQMALYGWLMGAPVGSEQTLYLMEELCCKPATPSPLIRVAHQRSRIYAAYQRKLMDEYKAMWAAITTGFIFEGQLSREENDERCEILDAACASMSDDDYFTEITRIEKKF
jgi:hypothetical protein